MFFKTNLGYALKNMQLLVLINPVRGLYEEILVPMFQAYGQNAVRSMGLESQNKYFSYGWRSHLIRGSAFTYSNKPVYDETLLF